MTDPIGELVGTQVFVSGEENISRTTKLLIRQDFRNQSKAYVDTFESMLYDVFIIIL